ncbi:PIG-L deacetylase family protein [Verrucomicrobiota bacterium sgz303538]
MNRAAPPSREGPIRAKTEEFLRQLCDPVVGYLDHPVAIVCAHPDDETIGIGSRLPRLRNVAVLHVTDGAPAAMSDALRNGFDTREKYTAERRAELEAALALVGVRRHQLHQCNIPDQGTSLMMAVATLTILEFLERFSPEVVVTHPYEGGHPDHDATAFAVHAACRLAHQRSGQEIGIVEMTSYHNRNGSLAAGKFIESSPAVPISTARLEPKERELKQDMFACFRTQASVLVQFPIDAERFRPAPKYDFTRAPHSGPLFYELHPWGMTGECFRAHANGALRELGLTASTL